MSQRNIGEASLQKNVYRLLKKCGRSFMDMTFYLPAEKKPLEGFGTRLDLL
jgi:hypothetical protein